MSVDRVLEEIRFQIRSHERIRYLFFADDIFNLDSARSRAIVEGMLRTPGLPPWGVQVRHEASRDRELLSLMHRANCGRVFVGFESVNRKTLERYNKHESLDQIEEAVRSFRRHRIKVHGMFVIGADEDTVQTVHDTARLSKKWGIDTVQFLILTPIPGSSDFETYRRSNRMLTGDWRFYDGHHVVFSPRLMSPFELAHETFSAMRRFYDLGSLGRKLARRDIEGAVLVMKARKLLRAWLKRNRDYLGRLETGLRKAGVALARPGRSPRPPESGKLPPYPAIPLAASRRPPPVR